MDAKRIGGPRARALLAKHLLAAVSAALLLAASPAAAQMQSSSAIRGCSNWRWNDPVYRATPAACYQLCGSSGANACEWSQNGDCYVEFASGGCTVASGFPGWWAAVMPVSASPMAASSAVRGCVDWRWDPPFHAATAAACYQACASRAANACEWYQDGSCFSEYATGGCYVQGGFPGWSAAVLLPATPIDGATMGGNTLPGSLYCGQPYTASVTVQNSGNTTWSEAGLYRLGAVSDSDAVGGPGRVLLPAGTTVLPGAAYTFRFPLAAPLTPGSYLTDWRMVHDRVAWFGQTASRSVAVHCTQGDDALIVAAALPTSLACGQTLQASVTVMNVGNTTWSEASQIRLGAVGDSDALGGPGRVYLPGAVPPGQQVTLSFPLTGPQLPGTYVTDWRMVHEAVAWFGATASSSVDVSCSSTSAGALELDPAHPHYLREQGTGKPVLLTGYGSIVPSLAGRNYRAEIDALAAAGVRYARVWHLGSDYWPWARANGRYDLGSWDPTYWARLKDALAYASARGIYAEIHFFDGSTQGLDGDPTRPDLGWPVSPWNPANNVNGLEAFPAGATTGLPQFYETVTTSARPRLAQYQRLWVDKLLDETIAFPNVIYEIENEHRVTATADWSRYWAGYLKARLAAKGASRLVAFSSLIGLEQLFDTANPDNRNLDLVNKHFGGEGDDPAVLDAFVHAHWAYARPVLVDEFANGVADAALLQRMAWTIVTSGGHFHVEDAEPTAALAVVSNIEAFKQASAWAFASTAPYATPLHGAAGDGTCMAERGASYLCYVRSAALGGSPQVTLPLDPSRTGAYRARIWDPRSGGFTAVPAPSGAGGTWAFSLPSVNDWVVYVTAQ